MQQIEQDLWAEFQTEINKKPKYESLKSVSVKYPNHKPFWNYILANYETLPEGKRNIKLEKNMAIWLVINAVDVEQIKSIYQSHKRDVKPLLGWIKKVCSGELLDYNVGELILWCIENQRQDLADMLKDNSQLVQDNEVKIMSDLELQNYTPKQIDWLIENFVKSGGIAVIGGKRSTLKSWLCLNISYCVAQGLDFLGKYKTFKGAVLYLDRENQFSELKIRSRLIKQGLSITEGEVYFLSESYIKIDNPKDIQKLETIIKEKQIRLIVVDVYRRVIGFDENDAREVSKLFVDLLKPLTERTGVSIILIHHEKKGESSGDDMDMLRGSSDLANYVDAIIQLERKGNNLVIKQSKNRAGKELEPFQVKIETDETSFFKFEYVGNVEGKDSKIAKVVIDWIIQKKIKSFTYTECWNYVKSKGFKETTYKTEALPLLVSQGIIKKGEGWRDPYMVTQDLGGYSQ